MKFLLVAGFCVLITSCAASSGGDVVGNGLTANPSRTQVMDAGSCTEAPSCQEGSSCGCGNAGQSKATAPEASEDCGCGHPEHHFKAKGKGKVKPTKTK